MFESRIGRIKTSLGSPFFPGEDLTSRADRLHANHIAHLAAHPIPDAALRGRSFGVLSQYLSKPENQAVVTSATREFIRLVQSNETDFYSESHDLFHVAEMVGTVLDDRARGVMTDNATVFVTTGFALIHDLGRRIEKLATTRQIDLTTDLHHNDLSFRGTDSLLRSISRDVQMPLEVKKSFARLLFSSLHFADQIGKEDFIAIPADTDRRQLLGSPTAGRDISYFGGMQGKDLSPSSILGFPPGYAHYDSGGFFGQHDWAKGYVYRDPSIRESRGLNFVYDNLAAEAMTILLLACRGDKRLSNSLRVIPDLPPGRITDSQGRPWMPRRALPEDIYRKAQAQALEVEERIPDQALSTDQTQNLFGKFVQSYGTIIDRDHLEKVLENVGQFSPEDRVKWARILYFAHNQNLQRYALRRSVLDEEQSKGTFLGKISEPFVEILESRKPYQEEVTEFFQSLRAA